MEAPTIDPVIDSDSPEVGRLCVVKAHALTPTETFIRAHVERLVPDTVLIDHPPLPLYERGGRPLPAPLHAHRLVRRKLDRRERGKKLTEGYVRLFQQHRPDVVLAEFGTTGAVVVDACEKLDIPLVVHFHGYEISKEEVVRANAERYHQLGRSAAALVAVSTPMKERVLAFGPPPERVVVNPCGVDMELFEPTRAESPSPVFLSVGRFVEKKAPHLVILSFARAHERDPTFRLRMVGDGPLMGVCTDLVHALGIQDAVTFLGHQSHEAVQREMKAARGFLQHSVIAASGDREGAPVSVLEANASALPLVATSHEGIADVVIPGVTGLLVEERDVNAMADGMLRLVNEPEFAAQLGRAARERTARYFSMERSLGRLRHVLKAAAARRPIPAWDETFGREGHV